MIDSHAHLIWESFDADRDELMDRAYKAEVKAFVHPCVHVNDLPKMYELTQKYRNVFMGAGVHPCDAQEWDSESRPEILKYRDKIVAIGETGLDFYHKDCPIETQEIVFRKQCQLAKELNLPLIVHCRDAFEDTLRVLREENVGKGVMHCYTGDAEYSAKFWELGFYTSFSGCLTFKNSEALRQASANIGLERTLLETDCPFLAPQKYRGKRNEPSFVTEVCQNLASIHSRSYAQIDEITTQNTIKLFNLSLN
jgi:TatD DNase family protein